jgi:hypothetical protein
MPAAAIASHTQTAHFRGPSRAHSYSHLVAGRTRKHLLALAATAPIYVLDTAL